MARIDLSLARFIERHALGTCLFFFAMMTDRQAPAGAAELESPVRVLPMRIPCGRTTLDGDLRIPAAALGLVLFAHGSGSSRHSPRNQAVAAVLHRAGIGTLLFDLLTASEEREDAATGHLRFAINLLSHRLVRATEHLAGVASAQGLGVGYFGASTGAAAALCAAADFGARIQAVVSRGGRPDLAGESLRSVQAPTLLIVGERDEEVVQMNRRAYDEMTCEKSFEIVPGATHLFPEPGALDEVARLATAWFLKHLRKQP